MISAQQPINVVVSQPAAVVQSAYPPQPQVVVVGLQAPTTAAANVGPRQTHMNTLFGLGIAECMIGSLSILLAVIAIAIEPRGLDIVFTYYTYTSQGIWCGIFVITTGILGLRVKYTPSRGLYIANMIMAIFTAINVFSGLVLSGIAAALSFYSGVLIAIHSIIALFCFVAMIIAIVHSAFCCSGVYATDSAPQQQVIYPSPQVVGYTQQQSLPQAYVQHPAAVQPVMPQKKRTGTDLRSPLQK